MPRVNFFSIARGKVIQDKNPAQTFATIFPFAVSDFHPTAHMMKLILQNRARRLDPQKKGLEQNHSKGKKPESSWFEVCFLFEFEWFKNTLFHVSHNEKNKTQRGHWMATGHIFVGICKPRNMNGSNLERISGPWNQEKDQPKQPVRTGFDAIFQVCTKILPIHQGAAKYIFNS